MINIADRSESYNETILDKIKNATGLYFTGGNQLHITALTGGTPLHHLIFEKFYKGLTIGGISAGAMMSSSMLLSGLSDLASGLNPIALTPGIELLDRSIIDTHFSQRGRHGRLLSSVAHNPRVIAMEIDERTAIVVESDKFEVIGEGVATVVSARN